MELQLLNIRNVFRADPPQLEVTFAISLTGSSATFIEEAEIKVFIPATEHLDSLTIGEIEKLAGQRARLLISGGKPLPA